MSKKITTTLAVCAVGAAVFVALLFRSGDSSAPATAAVSYGTDDTAVSSGSVDDYGTDEYSTGDYGDEPAATITIESFAFGSSVPVAPGSSVLVSNADGAPHTVTADSDSFTTATLSPGDSETIVVPDEPGTYTFFCNIHPSMTGSLTVG